MTAFSSYRKLGRQLKALWPPSRCNNAAALDSRRRRAFNRQTMRPFVIAALLPTIRSTLCLKLWY
jgi:hypothetical protein